MSQDATDETLPHHSSTSADDQQAPHDSSYNKNAGASGSDGGGSSNQGSRREKAVGTANSATGVSDSNYNTNNNNGNNSYSYASSGRSNGSHNSSSGGRAPQTSGGYSDEEFAAIERRARVALEAIAARDADGEAHLPAYLESLQEYRRACHDRALYQEAHLVQQVLRNVRLEEESRHVRGLTEQQMEERRALEEAHRLEFRRFHEAWNEKIELFEEEQLEAEVALLERQNDEVAAFHAEMRERAPDFPKQSRELLEARGHERMLAEQREYTRAQQAKRQADALEQQHRRRYDDARAEAYARRGLNLRQRHQQELQALRTKVESRRLYLERTRRRDLDELLQRYINARAEMETSHNIVRNKTGALLLKHSCNTRSDKSGTAVVMQSALAGTFGSVVQRRHQQEAARARQQAAQEEREANGGTDNGYHDSGDVYIGA